MSPRRSSRSSRFVTPGNDSCRFGYKSAFSCGYSVWHFSTRQRSRASRALGYPLVPLCARREKRVTGPQWFPGRVFGFREGASPRGTPHRTFASHTHPATMAATVSALRVVGPRGARRRPQGHRRAHRARRQGACASDRDRATHPRPPARGGARASIRPDVARGTSARLARARSPRRPLSAPRRS